MKRSDDAEEARSSDDDDKASPPEEEGIKDDDIAASSVPASGQVVVYDEAAAVAISEQLEREEAELAMLQMVLGSVFSCRKPRDVMAGTSSGLKSLSKGVGIGLAALIAQPYLGAKHSGAKGFLQGVGSGVLTCTASTVTGTVVGTGQILRGVLNTPKAVVQKARGQVWNKKSRKWEVDWYSLPEEAAEVLHESGGDHSQNGDDNNNASGSSASQKRPKSSKKVVDTGLYDVLNVQSDATDAEIRKAFYKLSLQHHPDKNPDNPESTQLFQAVSDAYRVLSDPDRRRQYDECGKDSAAAGLSKIEPVVFFAALFGSHHFEKFVGRLRLAQDIDGDLQSLFRDATNVEDMEGVSVDVLKVRRAQKQMFKVEKRRQVQCAVDLAAKLEPLIAEVVDEDVTAEWERQQVAEVNELTKVPFGVEMLFLIGWIYSNRAQQFFADNIFSKLAAQVEGSLHLAQSKAQLAGSIGKTCYTVAGVMKNVEKKKISAAAANPEEPTAESPTSPGASSSKDCDAAQKESTGTSGPSGGGTNDHRNGAVKEEPGRPSAEPSFGGREGQASDRASRRTTDATEQVPMAQDVPTARDESQGSSVNAPELPYGTLVTLIGLNKTPELNGEIGIVRGYDASKGRYLVKVIADEQGFPDDLLASDEKIKGLKRENLVVLPMTQDESTYDYGASSGRPTAGTATDGGQEQQYQTGEDAEMAAFRDCMPLFHDACWMATKLDIEFTLDKVIRKVLKDMSVSKLERRRRAQALLKLGTLLKEPMQERRRRPGTDAAPPRQEQGSNVYSATASTRAEIESVSSTNTSSSKISGMLSRLRQKTMGHASSLSKEERAKSKAKEIEDKQKRIEAAIALMAAGAATEDVDEMLHMRATMEAEMDSKSAP